MGLYQVLGNRKKHMQINYNKNFTILKNGNAIVMLKNERLSYKFYKGFLNFKKIVEQFRKRVSKILVLK